jgi:sodium transport system ATP-binding protein
MILAENLGKEFRDKNRGLIRAIADLSFYCKPGEVYGLLGANGAGKTTALRMLATILVPTSGIARVAGFDIRKEPAKARSSLGFLRLRRFMDVSRPWRGRVLWESLRS